jgi:hypothetical protein
MSQSHLDDSTAKKPKEKEPELVKKQKESEAAQKLA